MRLAVIWTTFSSLAVAFGKQQQLDFETLAAASAAAPTQDEPSAGVSEESSKRMADVIESIQDILATVESDEKKETENYQEFTAWCERQSADTKEALKEAKLQSEETATTIQELSATVEKLEQILEDTKKESDEAKDSVAQATSVREADNAKYTDDMQLNRQSLDQVGSAINIIAPIHKKKEFLQSGDKTVAGQKLMINAPGESNYVLGIMKGLQDQLSNARDGMESEEKGAAEQHEKYIGGETTRITSLQDTYTNTQLEHNKAKVELAEAKNLGEKLSDQIKSLTTVLLEVTQRCETKATEFTARSADRADEKAALKKAIDFLTKYFDAQNESPSSSSALVAVVPSFLQQAQAAGSSRSASHASLAAAHAQLRALEVTGAGAQGNVLNAAKEVVTKVLGTLEEEKVQHAEKNKYCKKAIEKTSAEQAATTADIERVNASVERKTSESEMLAAEVKAIDEGLETMKVELEKATEIRKKEKKTFEEGTRDRELATRVIVQAQKALRNFYKSKEAAALIQAKKADPPPETWSSDSDTRKTLQSGGVIEILGKVGEDIDREQKAAAKDETVAAAAFEQLQINCRDEFDEQMQAITQRLKTKGKLLVFLATDKETRTQKLEDLAAVGHELQGLHQECDELMMNFKQTEQAMAFEISQLRDIIDILSGSTIAARTGSFLVEPAAGSVDARELSLLHDMSQAAASLSQA